MRHRSRVGDDGVDQANASLSTPSLRPTTRIVNTTASSNPTTTPRRRCLSLLHTLGSCVALTLAAYAFIAVVMYWKQKELVFIGSGMTEVASNLPSAVTTRLLHREADNVEFRVFVVGLGEQEQHKDAAVHDDYQPGAPPKEMPVVVFFGGNAETANHLIYRIMSLHRAYGVISVAPEMPGYGLHAGPRSWTTFYDTARVATSYANTLARGMAPVVVVGSSLGTFSAMHVLAHDLADRALLHAPFGNLIDLAADIYWWAPARALMSDDLRFDNTMHIDRLLDAEIRRTTLPSEQRYSRRSGGQVGSPPTGDEKRPAGGAGAHSRSDSSAAAATDSQTAPSSPQILVLHGTRDTVVPFKMGKSLCIALGSLCRLVPLDGFGHNNVALGAGTQFSSLIKHHLSGL